MWYRLNLSALVNLLRTSVGIFLDRLAGREKISLVLWLGSSTAVTQIKLVHVYRTGQVFSSVPRYFETISKTGWQEDKLVSGLNLNWPQRVMNLFSVARFQTEKHGARMGMPRESKGLAESPQKYYKEPRPCGTVCMNRCLRVQKWLCSCASLVTVKREGDGPVHLSWKRIGLNPPMPQFRFFFFLSLVPGRKTPPKPAET